MLATLSGIPLRTIQQYEQRQKDINKARFDCILAFSQALMCKPENLYESIPARPFSYCIVSDDDSVSAVAER